MSGDALEVANHLVASLQDFLQSPLDLPPPSKDLLSVLQHLEVIAMPPGWIYWTLRPHGETQWLYRLLEAGSLPPPVAGVELQRGQDVLGGRSQDGIFQVQYAYARCCTVLRLAEQVGFVRGEQVFDDTSLHPSSDSSDRPWIPLLSVSARLGEPSLRVHHPDEHRLLAQMVTTVDRISNPWLCRDRAPLFTDGLTLSQDFLRFYATCLRVGDRTQSERILTQLMLVRGTQILLQGILQALNLETPTQL